MAVLGMPMGARMIEHMCVGLLPDLVEDVLSEDILIPGIEENFVSGMDDWWGDFTIDISL